MKLGFSFFLSSSLLLGCANHNVKPAYVQTVNSDLYPFEMSRDQYYEEMGQAYAKDQQSDRAIEEYRLALLHNPNRPSTRIALAAEYIKSGMSQLAVYELNEVLRVDPQNTRALLKLGELYIHAEIYSKAKEIFNQILVIDSKNSEARWPLFYVAKLERDDGAAEKQLSQIAETDSNRLKLFFEKAMLAKRLSKGKDYLKWINLAYASDPHDRKVCLEMKSYFESINDFDSAFIVLKHYSEAHDFNYEISQNLVYAAVRSKNYEVALNELEIQKSWVPDPMSVKLKKAHVYFLAGNLGHAFNLYQEISATDAANEESQFYQAQIYILQGQENLAQPILNQIKASSPYFADAQVWLATELVKKGNTEQALQILSRAQNQRPDKFEFYKGYADLLLQEKKYSQALSLLNSGIKFFPKSEDLLIRAAVAYFQIGQEDDFKKALDRALQINPENSEIYSALTELWYIKRMSPKEIEEFAKKSLSFKTKNRNVKPILAWALVAQDRAQAAVTLFEKFYEENPNQAFYAEALSKIYKSANIPLKGQKMNQQALKLQNEQRLQSDLIFQVQPQRSPANLKTH